MGSAAGLLRRGGGLGDNDVQAVDIGDEIGPEDASPTSPSLGVRSASGRWTTPMKDRRRGGASSSHLETRVQQLEELCHKQAEQLRSMTQTLDCVSRDVQRTISVLQYNILASYLGQNTQPWFLYGADITPDQRRQVFAKFYERDESGAAKNGWPAYVEGILTPDQIAAVVKRDEAFNWASRRKKLLKEIWMHNADILSLVELDHPNDFQAALKDQWDMIFHKRPREASKDGCGVFWRKTKFKLRASRGFDFVDGACKESGREKRDRCCLMVILEWRNTASPVVFVSTHLAKDPDDRSQTAVRVRQVTQMIEGLTSFTTAHGAADAPVILCGDLNAKHFGEIRGIARTVWQVTGSELHKFLWSASDVPTGPTSVTSARHCRIDAVQFLNSHLEVLEVKPVPRLPKGEVIPSLLYPSDHFPVFVRFRMKESYQMHRELARAWLECVAGREKVHPLTEPELRYAFDFFDRDRSNHIHRHDLEEACLDLQCNFHVDVQELLLDCFPDREIVYDNFIRAYEVRLNHERIRCIGELECAFKYFSGDRPVIPLGELEAAFREITPIHFSDEEVKEMILRLDLPDGQERVDLHKFCEIVCKASFPHKDRRKFCQDALSPRWPKNTRTFTKELVDKLDNISFSLSPVSRALSNDSLVHDGNTFEAGALSPVARFSEMHGRSMAFGADAAEALEDDLAGVASLFPPAPSKQASDRFVRRQASPCRLPGATTVE